MSKQPTQPQGPSLSAHKKHYSSSIQELTALTRLENNRTLKILAMARKEMDEQQRLMQKRIQAAENNQQKAAKQTRLANRMVQHHQDICHNKPDFTQQKKQWQQNIIEKNRESVKRVKEQEQGIKQKQQVMLENNVKKAQLIKQMQVENEHKIEEEKMQERQRIAMTSQLVRLNQEDQRINITKFRVKRASRRRRQQQQEISKQLAMCQAKEQALLQVKQRKLLAMRALEVSRGECLEAREHMNNVLSKNHSTKHLNESTSQSIRYRRIPSEGEKDQGPVRVLLQNDC